MCGSPGPCVRWDSNVEPDDHEARSFPLAGVSLNLSGLDLWFGDKTSRVVIVMYPMKAIAFVDLVEFLESGETFRVEPGRVELESLPVGWSRVMFPGWQVYPAKPAAVTVP